MRLSQYRYYFNYLAESGTNLELKDNSFLSTTEKTGEQKISLESVFVEVNAIFENQIKGYSIIDKLLTDGVRIFDAENKEIILQKKEVPLIQWSDESIEDAEYLEILEKIRKVSPVANTEESPKTDGADFSEKPPEEDAPFVYGIRYNNAKEKLEKVGFKHIEGNLSGIGFGFFWKGDNTKLLIDLGESIEVLNNVNSYDLGDDTIEFEKEGDTYIYSTKAAS